MINSTLCYIEHEGRFLMLYRNRKPNDLNEGKWIGVGGKFEPGEDAVTCMKREVKEETGLVVKKYHFYGIVRFISDTWESENMHLFSASEFSGKVDMNCNEGELHWVERSRLLELPTWEGDRFFLTRMLNGASRINMTLYYEGNKLVSHKDDSSLSNDLFSLRYDNGEIYGGSQMLCKNKTLKGYGCGLIGCANVLNYKGLCAGFGSTKSWDEYLNFINKLRTGYLPVIPKFGMNGIFMALGMEAYFHANKMKYHAKWGFSYRKIFVRMREMLDKDIPVVLAIGPNFPNLFGNKKLMLYALQKGKYVPFEGTKAHYVTVVSMNDEWLTISSWGRRLYINVNEYREYARRNSLPVFCNIIYVK